MAESNQINLSELLPVGATLQMGKYSIEHHLASGGFGNTYVVINTKFDERMAMKEFFMRGVSERNDHNTVSVSNSANRLSFKGQREKFNKEARRLRKLHNEHIVQVHDLFDENETSYYVMDYVDGESLSQRLKRTGKPLSEAEALDVFNQVLDALDSVHSEGIWHLDLKPSNIMVDANGVVKVIDFGASKQMSAGDGYTTTTTAMCYTPGYAPPEQIDQKMELIGPWTDLYALGGTLYTLLSCKQPPTVSELQDDDAFQYPAGVSERTRQLVQWMMTLRRAGRPQSVQQVKDFLASKVEAPVKQASVAAATFDESTVLGGTEEPQQPKKSKKSKISQISQNSQDSHSSQNVQDSRVAQDFPRSPWLSPKVIGAAVAGLALVMLLWWLIGSGSKEKPAESYNASASVTEQVSTAPENVLTNSYFNSVLGESSYTGPVDEQGQPHGIGEASFSDGRLYKGPFVHGKMEGDNVTFIYDNGDSFNGSFKDNQFLKGRYTIKADGSYFDGTFKNGQPDKGQWYSKSGTPF